MVMEALGSTVLLEKSGHYRQAQPTSVEMRIPSPSPTPAPLPPVAMTPYCAELYPPSSLDPKPFLPQNALSGMYGHSDKKSN